MAVLNSVQLWGFSYVDSLFSFSLFISFRHCLQQWSRCTQQIGTPPGIRNAAVWRVLSKTTPNDPTSSGSLKSGWVENIIVVHKNSNRQMDSSHHNWYSVAYHHLTYKKTLYFYSHPEVYMYWMNMNWRINMSDVLKPSLCLSVSLVFVFPTGR